MKLIFRSAVWALLACCAAQLASCKSPEPVEIEADLGLETVQFDDVPIPAGMTLRTEGQQSHSRVAGGYRYADFVYTGRVSESAVRDYLLERMPLHGWEVVHVGETTENGQRLEFQRGLYDAACVIERDRNRTRLIVEVRTEPDRTR